MYTIRWPSWENWKNLWRNVILSPYKESRPTDEFYDKAIQYLARHDVSYRKHMDNFVALIGPDSQAEIQAFLEKWADELAGKQVEPYLFGTPYQLRLLIRFYRDANREDKVRALQKRLRRVYVAFYEPLLEGCEADGDWQMVIAYGREVMALLSEKRLVPPYPGSAGSVDANKVRTQMARAYEKLGDPENALHIYRPVYDRHQDFLTYAVVKRLATAVNPQQGARFTRKVIAGLEGKLPQSRHFLCQVYLSENRFNAAYDLARRQIRYQNLGMIKLVAKAHLLAGFGPEATSEMGALLQDLYAKVSRADNDATLFLRDHLPPAPAIDRKTAVTRAENLYRNLMQLHIDNGRKTYATAAYYCALLGEIAAYDGREAEFKQFYQDLLGRYPRHRALRRELAAKVEGT